MQNTIRRKRFERQQRFLLSCKAWNFLKKYKNLSKMGNLKRMNFEDFPKHVNFDWGLGTHNFEKYILIMSNTPTSLVI